MCTPTAAGTCRNCCSRSSRRSASAMNSRAGIGIWPRHRLVDGTETTQPEFSFWFSDVGWSVENYGVDPDIEVDNAPQDYAAGRDRQLETALAIALERVEK